MSVIINGDTGITTPAETVQGALTTTGNTILGDASTDTLTVGVTGIVKDANGNVGIGTASPTALRSRNLEVFNASGASVVVGTESTSLSTLRLARKDATDGWDINYNYPVASMLSFNKLGTNSGPLFNIDSSGNVGIGISAPSKKLEIYASAVSLQIESIVRNDMSGAGVAAIGFNVSSSLASETTSTKAGIGLVRSAAFGGGSLCFYNNNSGAAGDFTTADERMRIDSSGRLLVGVSSPVADERLNVTGGSSQFVAVINNDYSIPYGMNIKYSAGAPNNTGQSFFACNDTSVTRAEIRSNGGLANYSANNVNLSDERTKKDIIDAGNYLDKICAIPVRTFLYKDQTDDELNLGVIAQEVEAVAPELVDLSGFGETPEDGVPLKAIYQTDLQYALMKSIQELKAIVDAQAVRIAALEA